MSDDPNCPMVLTTVPTEVQAELIVAALAGRGVEARTEGGLTCRECVPTTGGATALADGASTLALRDR